VGAAVSITDDVRPAEPRLPESRPADARTGDGQFDRSPPQDVAAEQCVIGGMLLSKDAIADVVEILKVGDFYRPAHGTIFDAILDLYGRGEPADSITIAAALSDAGELARVGGAAYLHTLISSVPTAANAGYYARIVSERAVLRRLIEAGTRIVQLGYGSAAGGGRDVDDLVDLAQQTVYDVTERRVSEDFAVLSDLLQPTLDEIEAVGAQGGVMTGVPTGFTDLDRLLNGLHAGQLIIVAGRPGLGKALALDTPLPTPDGWTTMGQVGPGDRLIGADGRPTTVVALSEIMHGRRCYEVEFSDGSVIVADGSHRWLTHTRASRRNRRSADVRTTEEIGATLRTATADRRLNHSVTNCQPLQLAEQELLVPPYVLGVWLGDGHSAGSRFSTDDPEIVAYIEAEGLDVRPSGPRVYTMVVPEPEPLPERACMVCGQLFRGCVDCGRTTTAAVRDGSVRCRSCHAGFGSVTGRLRTIGVLGDKHIPTGYLRASEAQRRPACWTPTVRWLRPAMSSTVRPPAGWPRMFASWWSAWATGAPSRRRRSRAVPPPSRSRTSSTSPLWTTCSGWSASGSCTRNAVGAITTSERGRDSSSTSDRCRACRSGV